MSVAMNQTKRYVFILEVDVVLRARAERCGEGWGGT
jgi:hypothetical protein